MNLANKLTISRIVLAGIFILFLFIRGAGAKFMALALFMAACVTDYYDGYIDICQIYHKTLSPTEILQNYNATKSRYGL